MPFQDYELKSFVANAPEALGKGLDLKPVKYPLKKFLEQKMKFPMEIGLGPHSYIYDTDPNFNILSEYLYSSGLKSYFKENSTLDSIQYSLEIREMKHSDYFTSNHLFNQASLI